MVYLKVDILNFIIISFCIISITSLSFSLLFPYYEICYTKLIYSNKDGGHIEKEYHKIQFYGTYLIDLNYSFENENDNNYNNETEYQIYSNKISYSSYDLKNGGTMTSNSVFQVITSMTLTGFIAKAFPIPMVIVLMYIKSNKPHRDIIEQIQNIQNNHQNQNNENNENNQNEDGADVNNNTNTHTFPSYDILIQRYNSCASYYGYSQLVINVVSCLVTLFSTFVVTHRLPLTMKLFTQVDDNIFLKSLCYYNSNNNNNNTITTINSDDIQPFGYCKSFIGLSEITDSNDIINYKWSPSQGWYMSLLSFILDFIIVITTIVLLYYEAKFKKPKQPSKFTNILNLSDFDLIYYQHSIRNHILN